MVKGIYVQALEKDRVEEELPSFSMLVMKCSASSPILKHCAKHGKRIISILWQPWSSYSMRSFFLVHEFSPMLSMMLGMEGEDGPSCNSWSPSLMCMNIIFNVSSPLLPQFSSTSSYTTSWSQSLLHIVVASFNSSLSHCYLIFTNFFFQFPEQNMYWNIAPLRSAWIFLYNESSFAQNWFQTRELGAFAFIPLF